MQKGMLKLTPKAKHLGSGRSRRKGRQKARDI